MNYRNGPTFYHQTPLSGCGATRDVIQSKEHREGEYFPSTRHTTVLGPAKRRYFCNAFEKNRQSVHSHEVRWGRTQGRDANAPILMEKGGGETAKKEPMCVVTGRDMLRIPFADLNIQNTYPVTYSAGGNGGQAGEMKVGHSATTPRGSAL